MKHVRRIASMLLALLLLCTFAAPALAVNTEDTPNTVEHTITINGTEGHIYQAYQIFRGDISMLDGEVVLTNITWGTGINQGQIDLFLSALRSDATIGTDFAAALDAAGQNNQTSAEAAAMVVASYVGADNMAKLDAFAEVVGDYLSNTCEENNGDTITVIGEGYYLLKDKDGSVTEKGDAYTKFILKVVADVTVTAKADAPSLDKNIKETDTLVKSANGSIGESVVFQIDTQVPEMDGYDKYFFIVHDSLSNGLTFNDDVIITIESHKRDADGNIIQTGLKTLVRESVDDATGEVSPGNYVVNVDGQKIEIVFRDFQQYKSEEFENAKITITYSATINGHADLTETGNPNEAYLQYSNNPNIDNTASNSDPDKPYDDDITGVTPVAQATVYTTALKLWKVNDKVGDQKDSLTGAKFEISSGDHHGVYVINKEIFVSDNQNGTYYRLKDGTYTETEATELTAGKYESTTEKYAKVTEVVYDTAEHNGLLVQGWVDENGYLTFTGLGEGTYTITELVAPEGYNKLKNPITVVIEWNEPTDEEGYQMWTVTASTVYADESTHDVAVNFDGTDNYFFIEVVNKAGFTLPATGGIGTTIFYVIGGILVLAAVVLLVTKKRMSVEEN